MIGDNYIEKLSINDNSMKIIKIEILFTDDKIKENIFIIEKYNIGYIKPHNSIVKRMGRDKYKKLKKIINKNKKIKYKSYDEFFNYYYNNIEVNKIDKISHYINKKLYKYQYQ